MAAVFKLTSAVCKTFNESWVTIEHCRLRAISREKTVANIDVNVHYPAEDIYVRLQVLKKANGYKPWIIDSTVDACGFMRKNNQPVAKIVYNLIKEKSTVNHTCPYTGLQQIRDFYLRPDMVPLPFPTGDYALFMTWIFSGKPQFATNLYFTFAEDLIKQ
ncbi:uncharacterized protein Dwil_GK27078 [Drosophila willistoni]|uniref:uncharacterized protein LOC26529080 n=1 Tax=Drosophila willistoni TaxID=7260 RepID=UPI000732837F|nr:uncharacterized protein LOC26529080 [Drosophila willistoni]KRF97924.1 uncharacterized protein Dwil_GK27078 [Drosophila willistoni]